MKKTSLSGFLMFEVLISITILSLVFLSLLRYQMMMLKSIEQVNFRMIAMQQLFNFSEMRLIAQSNSQKNNFFTIWNTDNKNLLPQGTGSFSPEENHQCRITLFWVFQKKEQISEVVFC